MNKVSVTRFVGMFDDEREARITLIVYVDMSIRTRLALDEAEAEGGRATQTDLVRALDSLQDELDDLVDIASGPPLSFPLEDDPEGISPPFTPSEQTFFMRSAPSLLLAAASHSWESGDRSEALDYVGAAVKLTEFAAAEKRLLLALTAAPSLGMIVNALDQYANRVDIDRDPDLAAQIVDLATRVEHLASTMHIDALKEELQVQAEWQAAMFEKGMPRGWDIEDYVATLGNNAMIMTTIVNADRVENADPSRVRSAEDMEAELRRVHGDSLREAEERDKLDAARLRAMSPDETIAEIEAGLQRAFILIDAIERNRGDALIKNLANAYQRDPSMLMRYIVASLPRTLENQRPTIARAREIQAKLSR